MTDNTLEGYKANEKGHLVPISEIEPWLIQRDELVHERVDEMLLLSNRMAELKKAIFDDITAHVDLVAEQYGQRVGGRHGNVRLNSFDGSKRLQVMASRSMAFDERMVAAKALIDECIQEWESNGTNPYSAELINQAFKVGKSGKLNTQKIIEMLSYKIDDKNWQIAMKAVRDSLYASGKVLYLHGYIRNSSKPRIDGKEDMKRIVLDFAGV